MDQAISRYFNINARTWHKDNIFVFNKAAKNKKSTKQWIYFNPITSHILFNNLIKFEHKSSKFYQQSGTQPNTQHMLYW